MCLLYLNKAAWTKISKRRQGKDLEKKDWKSLWQETGYRVGGVWLRIAAFDEEP